MQPLVIDIYHGDPVQDFAKTKAFGILGVIHKATQGGAVGNTVSGGYWNTAGVVDGFQVLMDSGNLTSGQILIYGIQ